MLLAYLDDPKVKKTYLARVRAHVKADEIIKGKYWEGGKGCAVGCTIHSDQHSAYETELGIPQMLARLEDRIFEGSSLAFSKSWPERFLRAIKPGADLSRVGWKFQHWLLLDPKEGVIRFAREQDKPIFERIGGLVWDLALGKQIDQSAAESAESAARSAAESAARLAWSAESAAWSAAESARSAAWSAAESAARLAWSAESAAWSAAESARSAAWSAELAARSAARSAESAESAARLAARSAARSAESAESAAYEKQGGYLLKLLKEAK